jgi:hypothetical protein
VGVVAVLKAGAGAEVRVRTAPGEFRFQPGALTPGALLVRLNGAAAVERMPADFPLTKSTTEDDFPAAAAGPAGTVWVAYVAYRYGQPEAPQQQPVREAPRLFDSLRPTGNGDQVRLGRLTPRGDAADWAEVAALTEPGQDVARPAVAVDAEGSAWVVWSQNIAGNWDLYARRWREGGLSAITRITTDPAPDLSPTIGTDREGRLWLAWQGFRGGQSDIFLVSLARGGERWSDPQRVSDSPANDWDPQLAVGGGAVHVAWDTYDRGDYDVMLRSAAEGRLGAPVAVAATPRFEARASVACDPQDRVWVAWEEAPAHWGKDFGYEVPAPGVPLYRYHTVAVRCYVAGQPRRTVGDLAPLLPSAQQPPEVEGEALGPGARRRAPFQASFPRLGVDRAGRLFLAYRRAVPEAQSPLGMSWFSYITTYAGNAWTAPVILPASDGLLDNRPALAPGAPGGPLYVIHSTDGRSRVPVAEIRSRIYAAPLNLGPAPAAPQLVAAEPAGPRGGDPLVEKERADVARVRGVRAVAGGKTYQPLRGEFHRHTEISADGGGDGPLCDTFRYALDAAQLDWIGNGDHDNGAGREYTWWLIQKLTDAFFLDRSFTPMFTYERSVRYPDGHRNVMFAQRGIRTLPRLAGDQPNGVARGDTAMLYRYLKVFDGICASHTSATDMGTDWRDNDPQVEPFVEIYQGDRQNYEAAGAPRSGELGRSPGGFQPAGFIWNALAKGYRLGFQSSSDHISTHISLAVALAETPTRAGVLAAFKARRCYAATDNIGLVVSSGEHLMGEEWETKEPPRLTVRVVGTGPVARVVVVKNNAVVYTAAPGKSAVELSWLDGDAAAGDAYYYVRVEQADGQLAWASPMWIHYRP